MDNLNDFKQDPFICSALTADILKVFINHGMSDMPMYMLGINAPCCASSLNEETSNLSLIEYVKKAQVKLEPHPFIIAGSGLSKKGDCVEFFATSKEEIESNFNVFQQIKAGIIRDDRIPANEKDRWMHVTFNKEKNAIEYV